MKKILFVEHGQDIKGYAIQAAYELGLDIFIVSNTKIIKLPQGIDEKNVFISDTFDSHTLLIDTLNFIEGHNIDLDAVVTFRENCVIPTADLASAFGLKGISSEGARRSSQNKVMMRHRLKYRKFANQPNYTSLNLHDEKAEHVFANFPKPCVIKPLFGTASHGVLFCDNLSNFNVVKNQLLAEVNPSAREIFKKFDGTVILEEFKDGALISVDGIVKDSKLLPLGTLEFVMGNKPYFTQVASHMPARISPRIRDLLYDTTQEIISILGFQFCGIHAEFRVEGEKVWLIEIAARLAGATIHETYKRVYGNDLVKDSLLNLLNDKTPIFNKSPKNAYHHLVFPNIQNTSILDSVITPENEMKDVLDLLHFAQPGSTIQTYPHNPTPILGYLLMGNNSEALQIKGEEIDKNIIISLKTQ